MATSGMARCSPSGGCLAATLLVFALWQTAPAALEHGGDPHYDAAGFFDIHVCNWPDRALFFMPLFSSERYDDIRSVEVFQPTGEKLTDLDLDRYRIIRRKGKPDKHAFIMQVDVPPGAVSGWYTARIRLQNGDMFKAKDYVILQEMQQVTGQAPADGEELDNIPDRLTWSPVPGANYYQVFIRDLWDNERLILSSSLLDKPEIVLPPGTLHRGGLYSWVVHARDTNEHVLLGDFNHGSLNTPMEFSIGD